MKNSSLKGETRQGERDPVARVLKEASVGRVKPLLWVYGDDQGRVAGFIKEMRKILLKEEVRALNEGMVDAKELPLERIVELARGLPMLSDWRLIVVDNAHEIGQKDWTKVMDYLRRPTPTSCVIFRAQKPPPGGEVLRVLVEKGEILEMKTRSEASAMDWIEGALAWRGKRITKGASRLLLELVGTSQGILDSELEKLVAFVGENEVIEEHHVQELVAGVRTRTLFQLADALGEGKLSEALRIMNLLMDQGTNPLATLSMLARQLRLLHSALLWRKGAADACFDQNQVPEFLRERLLRQCINWSEERILRALMGLAQIDREIKSGKLEARWLLDQWITQFGL